MGARRVTRTRSRGLDGPAVVGLVAALAAVWLAVVLALEGTGEAGLRAGIRATARAGVAVFSLTFAASSIHALFRGGLGGKWLMRNRRWLGLGYAATMGMHLSLIVALALGHSASFRDGVSVTTLVGGGVGYLLLLAMVVTSFDGPTKRLGRTWWRRLHLAGMYAQLLIFAFSYAGRTVAEPLHAPALLALAAALGLRAARTVRQRRRRR